MKYLLLAYIDETIWEEGELEACREESRQLCHTLNEEGVYLHAAPLYDVDTATSIRVRQKETLVTDGPFAETHEQLGGYFMIDVDNLDAAIAVAARLPSARFGTIEIRPMVEMEDMPEKKI